jgi:hypothetical protein
MAQAATQHSRGQSATALELVKKALGCKQSARLYRFAATYACAAHDFDSAKAYLAKLPSSYERTQIEEKCEQERRPPKPTSSMSQAEEIATRLNEEGKELLYHDQYDAAVRKFQEAAARVPEAKYFLNLCVAQFQAGRFSDALTACMAVDLNQPTDAQRSKAAKLIERLKAEAKKQGIDLR